MALIPIVEPQDRSISPVAMMKVIAIEIMPTQVAWRRMTMMLDTDRNDLVTMDRNRHSTRNATSTPMPLMDMISFILFVLAVFMTFPP